MSSGVASQNFSTSSRVGGALTGVFMAAALAGSAVIAEVRHQQQLAAKPAESIPAVPSDKWTKCLELAMEETRSHTELTTGQSNAMWEKKADACRVFIPR